MATSTWCCRSPRAISIPDRNDLARLERQLDYRFSDRTHLEQALTHKSFSKANNERLEFLGDALLGYVIARDLFDRFPEQAEDRLTILRASLVRKDTLHAIARAIGLGAHLKLGLGELRSGGRERASILADALEAVIGAVCLDAGVDEAAAVVRRLFAQRLEGADPELGKDPKTRLQELLQARGMDLPVYEVAATSGSEHAREFAVRCTVAGLNLVAEGSGSSRRAAEKQAAQAMIALLDDAEG